MSTQKQVNVDSTEAISQQKAPEFIPKQQKMGDLIQRAQMDLNMLSNVEIMQLHRILGNKGVERIWHSQNGIVQRVDSDIIQRAVEEYEVGTYKDLKANSDVGDGLQIHHLPQANAAKDVIENYDKDTGTAIALTNEEHYKLKGSRRKGTYEGTATELFEEDIKILQDNTEVPSSKVSELKTLAKSKYPELNE